MEKTVNMKELIRQHRDREPGYSVFAGVGERTREGNDFYHEMTDRNVIDKVSLVYGQMNELPRETVCGLDRSDHGGISRRRPRRVLRRQHLPYPAVRSIRLVGRMSSAVVIRLLWPRRWRTATYYSTKPAH